MRRGDRLGHRIDLSRLRQGFVHDTELSHPSGSGQNGPLQRADRGVVGKLEFDMMEFVRDTSTRSISLPGSTILSVAVGFEIWNGPVTNLVSQDFYVDVK